MVRPRKLSAPVQCAQAVADRYGVILDTASTVDRQELDALQQDINARFVQVSVSYSGRQGPDGHEVRGGRVRVGSAGEGLMAYWDKIGLDGDLGWQGEDGSEFSVTMVTLHGRISGKASSGYRGKRVACYGLCGPARQGMQYM